MERRMCEAVFQAQAVFLAHDHSSPPRKISLNPACPICEDEGVYQSEKLLCCTSCQVQHYCCVAHQKKHLTKHRDACKQTKKARMAYQNFDKALRDTEPVRAVGLQTHLRCQDDDAKEWRLRKDEWIKPLCLIKTSTSFMTAISQMMGIGTIFGIIHLDQCLISRLSLDLDSHIGAFDVCQTNSSILNPVGGLCCLIIGASRR